MNSVVPNNTDFPPELSAKPLALIGVSGLDVVNNAVHKTIWETFSSNRRVERAPVLFKLIGNAHEFPVIKPKRTSYDWYIPKGILKKNWMNKHLYEIPAVMVVFYDLDWNDPQWREKMIECSSRVQSMRAALEGRNTKITVVLIQNTLPLPAGEDALASEGAVALCSSCELNSQCLFVLPHGDHLQGYAVRLEKAFFELAQTYYHNESKVVKGHKEHLNKNTHQYLLVRHQFKMGFLFELKQDIHIAHKHYSHAYNNLLEIRIVDTNALEVRTVAGFINYKICRLLFALNLPRDAISQFKSHIDRFKTRMGFQELSFEHYAWLSKQYCVFGDVFDEAVKLGLPAVQTQHPGIYYQQAAQYAIARKKLCQELCSNVSTYPNPDPLEGVNHMEFYGQRPWRPGKVSAEPPDPHLEASGIQALQNLELQVNHSNLIIALYGLAITQYKTYRCPRTRRHLVVQMADEYFTSKDYGKALTLYTHMLWDFRNEKWWQILSQLLEKAVRCAYLTANIKDYLSLAIEILGTPVTLSLDDKRRIYENLNRIIKKQIPYGDSKLPQDTLQSAIILWQPAISKQPLNFSIDMTNITCCIATKARFIKTKYEVDQNVTVEVFIRSTCPFPLTFSKVSVTINTSSFSSEFAVNNLNGGSLSFHKDEVKRFVIEFMADSCDINKDIQINTINISIGDPNECNLDIKFTPSNDVSENHAELSHFKRNTDKLDFDNIRHLSTAMIVPRESKLNVSFDHKHPALVGEWYEIKVKLLNEESFSINSLQIEISLEEETNEVELALKPSEPQNKLPLVLNNPQNLDKQGKTSTVFFVKSHRICKVSLQIQITYILKSTKPVFSIKNEVIELPSVQAFEVTTKYLSLLMNEVDLLYVGEDFGIMNYVKFMSPWPIIIEDTQFEFLLPIKTTEKSYSSQLKGKVFKEEEVGAELHLAVCEKSSELNVSVGVYTLKWRRQDGISTTTTVTVQGLSCYFIPIGINLEAPEHGFVRTPMVLNYHLYNRSKELVQLDVLMEASEAFMFSGYKQFQVSVLPKSTRTLQYIMYPLIAGSVALPKLMLSNTKINPEDKIIPVEQDQLNALIKRCLPTHIYVMPQIKGTPKLPDIIQSRPATIVN